ncbi:MAG: Gfo/Idh/MocA family protein [Candidatus Cryptobacteroides sp.]
MKGLFQKIVFLTAVCSVATAAVSCRQELFESSVPHRIVDGKIVLEAPRRAEGQESALQLTCDPMDTVRVGFIGLGMRGPSAVYRFTWIDGVRITALCDLEGDRVEKSQETLASRGFPAAKSYVGEDAWKSLCESSDVDLVYICTPWQTHVEMAVYAMEHGKHVALEVPAAMSIRECWELVDTSEKTRRHCMMLENCCYDFFEMTALNMAQHGLFGDIVYAEGGYIHNLDPYWTHYHGNWRLAYNQAHRGDVYPTHGIGPVCQALDIHRGDKMNYLVSMDTDSFHGKKVAGEIMKTDSFANGDQTVTLIRTEKGKMIQIQHNVYTRRPYDRKYQLVGEDGYACKYPVEGIALKSENLAADGLDYENLDGESFVSREQFAELMEQYRHPLVAEIEALAKKVGGHGGMDFIMDYRLVYCLRNGLPLDEDVYDAAEWSCLTELSGLSIAYGSMPVEIPDFTRGDWDKVHGFSHAR